MSRIKRWNGSKWIDYTDMKVRNGSGWGKATVKRWNGSRWELISQQTYTKTWEATWSQSYNGTNANFSKGKKRDTGWLYHGRYGMPYTSNGDRGTQRSMIGFNYNDIRNNLKGADIEKVEIYIRNKHWWYTSGGKAVIGYHNASSKPSGFSDSHYGKKTVSFSSRGQGQWITMPNDLGTLLRDGKVKGLTLFANTTALSYYGYFYGYSSSSRPKIRITYKK